MKRAALFILLTSVACATSSPGTSRNAAIPGHGALSISIQPNPIVAHKTTGDTYSFPFDAVVRETAGRAVTINRVTLDVYALGGVRVGTESYDAAQIAAMGFPTNVPGNGELRYHFAPTKDVSDDRLFGSVTGEVRVNGSDETGTPTSATTTVTVTR